ncbi:polycystic kidney disease 1-like 2 [Nesidiocoris tenuis]|nr:polycystic kidney disease 1-like 2 [Nesidiocoris tenuis]
MVLFSGCDREYFLNDDIIIRTRLDASDECKPLKIVKSMWRVYFGSKFLFSYANRLNALEIPRFRLREFGNYAVHFDFSGEVLDALGNFKLDLSRKCHLTMSPADIEIFIPEGTRQIARCPVDEQLKIEIRIMDPNAKLRARTSSIVASAHLEGEKISDGIFDGNELIFSWGGFTCDSNHWYEFLIKWPNYGTSSERNLKFYRQFSSTITKHIEFDCLFNCNHYVNPKFIFSLSAICKNCTWHQQRDSNWEWSSSNIPNFELIAVKQTPPNRLVLPGNGTLQFGVTYEVTVKFSDLDARYSFTTIPEPKLQSGSCGFQKEQPGFPGTVTCKDFSGTKPLFYEIYGRTNGTEECPHLLAASRSATLRLHPPSDQLLVRVTDRAGATIDFELKGVEKEVELNFIEGDVMKTLVHVAETVKDEDDHEYALELISSAAAMSSSEMNSTVVIKILDILSGLTNITESYIKTGASILLILSEADPTSFSSEAKLKIYESAAWVSEQWRLLNARQGPALSISAPATSKCLLRSLEAIRKVWDPLVTNPENSEEPSDLETALSRAQISTNHFLKAIESLLMTYEFSNVHFGITTEVSLESVKLHSRIAYLGSRSSQLAKDLSSDRVFFHEDIYRELGSFENVTVAECILTNVFWWDPEVNGSTDTVILKIFGYTSTARVAVEKLRFPVRIRLKKFGETPLMGNLTGVANSAPRLADDRQKIRYQKVFTFSQPPNSGGILVLRLDNEYLKKLKILITQDRFPSYNETLLSNITSHLLPFTVKPVAERHTLLYVSVLPSSPEFDGLKFEIGYYQEECQVYQGFFFNESICEVESSRLTTNEIFCVCRHLSTFSGNFFVAPNSLTNPLSIRFAAELKTNFYILVVVSIILIVFIALIIYYCLRDWRDTEVGTVRTLEDICPWHRAYYLIGLTSGRSGCPSNTGKIAIRLFGSKSRSRVHVLNPNRRTVLRSGSDSWFLLLTPKVLGKVRGLQLWTDHSGCFPFLYCSSVTVIDYKTKAVVQFACSQWMSAFHAHYSYFTATPQELIPKAPTVQIFGFNVARGCRGRNRWIRLISKYPSGDFTQSEEVCLTASLVTTNMLFSIMFFREVEANPFDPPSSDFTLRELVISAECILGSLLINSIALILFSLSKKTSKFKDCLELERLTPKWLPKIRTPSAQMLTGLLNTALNQVYESMFPPKFRPITMVHLEERHRKFMLVAAWTYSVIVNTLATVLIILYGLQYGRNRSIIWLKTLAMSLIEDATVIVPLKIFATSVIASFIFQGSTSKTISLGYIGVDKPKKYSEKLEILRSLLKIRSNPIYTGLVDNWSKDYSALWKARLRICNMILLFLLLALLLASTLITLSAVRIQDKFMANQNGRIMLSYKSEPSSLPAKDVKTKTDILNFIVHTLCPATEKISWYNGKLLSDLDRYRQRTLQYESLLLGVARITQNRIRSDAFQSVPHVFQKVFIRSYGFLTSGNQEKNWTFPAHPSNPLRIDMKHVKDESERLFTRLFITGWLDDMTRQMLVELPIYSSNLGLITNLNLCFIQHPSGVYLMTYRVGTSWLIVGWNEKIMYASIAIASTMVLMIGYYSYLRFAFMGGQAYINSWLTVLEILTILTSISTISTWIWKILDYYIFAKEPTELQPDEHHSFARLVANTDEFSINLSVLFLFLDVRVLALGYETLNRRPVDQEILKIVHGKAKFLATPLIFVVIITLLWGGQIFLSECDVNNSQSVAISTKLLLFFAPPLIFALMYSSIDKRMSVISRKIGSRQVKFFRRLKFKKKMRFKFPTPLEEQFTAAEVKLKQLEGKFDLLSKQLNQPTPPSRGRRKVKRQKTGH